MIPTNSGLSYIEYYIVHSYLLTTLYVFVVLLYVKGIIIWMIIK